MTTLSATHSVCCRGYGDVEVLPPSGFVVDGAALDGESAVVDRIYADL